jgi:hypothetical protein
MPVCGLTKSDEYITSGIHITLYSERKWNMTVRNKYVNCAQHFWHHSNVAEELKPSS